MNDLEAWHADAETAARERERLLRAREYPPTAVWVAVLAAILAACVAIFGLAGYGLAHLLGAL